MFHAEQSLDKRATRFIYLVYAWMALALAVTAGIAYAVATNPAMLNFIFKTPGVFFGLFIVQIGLVMALSAMIERISYSTAVVLFMLYASCLGLTLSAIFQIYTLGSISTTFGITAGMFGAMCLYGYTTRTDLTSMGSFAIMALFGLILGGLVNMWLQNPALDYALSAIGVLLFTALTAYDMQKIKRLADNHSLDHEMASKVALLGALTLYLDFINLFLYLLRFMGKKNNNS